MREFQDVKGHGNGEAHGGEQADDDADTMEIARDEASGRRNFKRGEVAWIAGLLEKGLGAPDIKREILRKLFMPSTHYHSHRK